MSSLTAKPAAPFPSPYHLSHGLALLLLFAAASPQRAAAASAASMEPVASSPSEPWKPYKTKRGIAVDRRPVKGSKYFEYRATVTSALPPAQVIVQMWRQVSQVASPVVKKRQVLRQSEDELIIYDQVATPVVSDRDYTLRIRKLGNADGSRFELTFETANDQGPPEQPKFVRLPAIRGNWIIESDGSGGSKLTYTTYSEPGGSIPAFMIHGAQFDNVIDNVLRTQETVAKSAK